MTVAELAPRCLVIRIWSINLSHFQSFLFCICPWIRQLLHWLYDNHGEEELCICLLQVNCELKKSIPYALPLKNRYCRFVFTLSLPKFCIGVMSFPMISLGFYIHPNIWHVCEAVLKFIGVYVWLGAVIWLNCWIMEQLQQKLSGFVFFYKWYCTKLCSLWFLAGPLKSKLQLLPSGNFRNNFPSMFLLLNNFSFILWGSLDLLSHHKYSYSSSSFATVLKTRFSQCSFVWLGDKV